MSILSGIYMIQSKVKPERVYIGSAINIYARWRNHLSDMRRNKHHSLKLQNHYNKYGKNDLTFSICISCSKDDLIDTEQFYLDSYKTFFNTCKKAGSHISIERDKNKNRRAGFIKGHKINLNRICTSETKKKISESNIGKKGHSMSNELRLKISQINKGKKQRAITRMRISEALKNNRNSFGHIHSQESRNKMSEAKKGKCTRLGYKHSEETKDKMRMTRLLRISNTKVA